MIQTLTVQVPDTVYTRLKQRAEQANRTVEAEVLDLLNTTVAAADELSPDLEEALAALALLNDAELWCAARSRMATELAGELETLHGNQQRTGLSAAEAQRGAVLLHQYERAMLVRAQAAALLKERGQDVASLFAVQSPQIKPSFGPRPCHW